MIARISKGQLLRWGALSVVLLSVVVVPAAGGAAPPPNIVVFMTDDEPAFDGRFTDWMPNRKALFQTQGVTFTDFHSSTPLCCPSRASFLTGQYTHNHGVYANKAALFNPSMSLATQLLGVGYQNFLVGKYMNGYGQCNKINCAPHVPPGWTRFAAFGNPAYYNYDFWVDGVRRSYGSAPSDYSTDVIRDTTLSFMRGANPSKPMFLWIATNGPHSPATPAPRHAGVNCNPARWTPPSWNEADVSDKPAYVRGLPLMKKAGSNSVTCRPLLAVDELIGAVRNELSSEGRLANTLFVYAGDNGMSRGEHRLSGKNAPYVTNVPFAMSWTGHIAAGTKISTRLENIDFAPTVCEIVGCTLGPYPNGQTRPDGLSFAPLLLQNTPFTRDTMLEELTIANDGVPSWASVITTTYSPLGLWQYTEYQTGEHELYDLSNGPCWTWQPGSAGDPCDLQNVAGKPAYASVESSLRQRLTQLKAQKGS